MGMIATVLNAIALKWALMAAGVSARAMSAFSVGAFIETFDREKALECLSQGVVTIFAGGTGNPCFTTDSAAALRAVEMEANVMIKATQASGVFDKDPNKYSDALFFESITPEEVLARRLGVMDLASIEILGRNKIPAIVLDLHVEGNIARALSGEKIGTIIG
jgi:uridylate kinase